MNCKYRVGSYWAVTEEDSYENGIIGSGTSWSSHEIPVDGEFDSISDALKAVCEANGLTYNKDWWEPEFCLDKGRFDTDIEVTEENCEAGEDDLAEWKSGNLRLWCCHLAVYLEKYVKMDITEEDWRNG